MLGMPPSFWALILKPLIAIPILAAMFFLPRYIARLIRPIIPRRWRAVLFEGWQHDGKKGRAVNPRRR